MKKTIQWTALILILIPAVTYAILVALIEWDRVKSEFLTEDKPSLVVHSKEPQKITLLNSGISALAYRLNLIDQAKSNIEIEYFIYELDQSSKLITQALLKKAAEGIKVRVIVDFSAPVFKLNPIVAAFMKQKGIEVRYYNTASTYQIFNVQHRSHRKLLVVDDQFVITGGRNIADDYFDISSHYNFFDSDVLIEGNMVAAFKKSFEEYWNSQLALDSQNIETDFSQKVLDESLNYLKTDPELSSLKEKVIRKSLEFENQLKKTTCLDSTYATDYPGSGIASRKVYNVLVSESQKAQKSIRIESPYFVLKKDGLSDFTNLIGRGIDVMVLTNTLNSTDAYYTVSAFAATLPELKKSGLEIWGYKGTPRAHQELLPGQVTSERWGLHAKRGIIDDNTTLIGTYNIDPRSANLNSEMIFICRNNQELAKAVLDDMNIRLNESVLLVQKDCGECARHIIQQSDFWSTLRFLIFIPISSRLDFLL